ncbi:MAG: L,D-transpeptidase [Actinomycetota bacterium]|nr:L,D-transpeptidase [Actinomycetota bacterium]
MAIESPPSPLMRSRDLPSPRRARRRARWGFTVVLVALLGLIAAVLAWSGVRLADDPTALARVDVQPFGGTLERVRAFGPGGRRIPLAVRDGRLTPRTRLTPGERVSLDVVVRRPGWLGWALGDKRHERRTLRAPVAHVSERWLTIPSGSTVRVSFDRSVSAVAYGSRGHLTRQTLDGAPRSLALGRRAAAGTVEVAAAARPWERLGTPVAVSWFPPARSPVAVSSPAPGARLAPAAPIRLTFSKPVADVLGGARPKLSPSTPGRWRQTDSHTLVFVPSGFGARFASELRIELQRAVAVTGSSGRGLHTTRRIEWTVPPGSILRLQQLLAQAGYLPLDWKPSGAPVARTPAAEVRAAVDPPEGRFSWRYPNTPRELRALWSAGRTNEITRGAVMTFQDTHGLDVDALAGAVVWHALLADAIAGKRRERGYSYVYVHSSVPQSLTLWHNGRTVLRSPGITGVPAAPTQLGTFPVFEHIPVGTMSGTNPGGSHYDDPGIRYISYFNGGDAIHAFDRASFGTPQSLGCVELPLASAAKVWPYTPIGTLVTVER